ncbi:AfsR/SARP family transcriptional regulator [Amycolatopsis anabasis]|uniref:AfsR/SARP family transcriptional regulator n=1 Tax=Amycolatopsis anabasis TaxID=1840409 RepID=UPI00131D7E97|nr:AfsR/SARP family transcriptional regulator [Amycolatopsis anabasis]
MKDVRFHILGPLAIHSDGKEIHLGGQRRSILLTTLLLEANQVLSLDRLIDAIWNETPPASAQSQVRICVSDLRRTFAAENCENFIQTRSSGYRINVPENSLDLYRFEDLVRRGRLAAAQRRLTEAVDLLKSALNLWRGPIAAGLNSELLRTSAIKFQANRQAAIEEYVELNLRLGRHREIVGELTGYVADSPFQENLCAQLMTALHRSGRKAEALEFFRKVRKRFADELGIEPGEKLQKLEAALLESDTEFRPEDPDDRVAALLGGGQATDDRLSRIEEELVQLRQDNPAQLRLR